jgi:outer membrane murein-binding lipoprotein Lpp
MKKPRILIAAVLAGGLLLTGCAGNRTPSSTNTASANNAASTSDTRVVGNSAGSIQSSQLEAERVGSGTMSGSTMSAAPNPGVTVPLNGTTPSVTSQSTAANGTDQGSSMTNSTSSQSMNNGQTAQTTTSGSDMNTTGGQTTTATQGGNTGMGSTTGSTMGSTSSNNSTATMSDERSGVNSGNPNSLSQTTTTPPAPPARNIDDTRRMRMANRRAPEQNAPATGTDQPPVGGMSGATTAAPPNSVQDRERMGRDAANPAGMEQRAGMTDYGTPEERTMPPMVSNQAEAIDRVTTRLDEIDTALANKMSARRKSALLRERKKLMYRLGALKAVEMPATPNQVPTGPGGAQRP